MNLSKKIDEDIKMMKNQIEDNALVKKSDDNNLYKNHLINNNSHNNSIHKPQNLFSKNTLAYTLKSLHKSPNGFFSSVPEQMEAKVLVIYTGGTVGMVRNENNGKYIFY